MEYDWDDCGELDTDPSTTAPWAIPPSQIGWKWIGNSNAETAEEAIDGYRAAFPQHDDKELKAEPWSPALGLIKWAVFSKDD